MKLNVLVLGDICVDEYIIGEVKRINPEAPVPLVDVVETKKAFGMAANVATNLRNLGVSVKEHCLGFTGTKTRIIDKTSGYQIVRFDESKQPATSKFPLSVELLDEFDAVVISDYDKGTLSYEMIKMYISKCESIGIPIFIDTKKTSLIEFDGAFIKVNAKEASLAHTMPSRESLIITLGSGGAIYKSETYKTKPIDNPVDVCGAGDTFFAALIKKCLETGNIPDAIKYANAAASITVQHIGAYAPTLEEIEECLKKD